ncbi:MAG TPA: SCO family protein [Xanthomonadales bacterium]|nr:SCO family protein [Xanthomonadales bacterium]
MNPYLTSTRVITACKTSLLALALLLLPAHLLATEQAGDPANHYDANAAIERSQQVLGTMLQPVALMDSLGQPFELDSLRGKPILVSMVFTSCYHVCPAITRHLATAVKEAKSALGESSFAVLTIGFDTPNDTPDAMAAFARQQKIADPDWHFLSGDAASMDQLTSNLGFTYFPSPRGFDHVNQLTLVDRDGSIYRQVYGADFELPALVEPLKELVYNRPQPGQPFSASLLDRIKLFCTVYDPTTGRYRFDFSLFVQIAVGGIFLLVLAGWLGLETVRARRKNKSA